VSRAIAVERHFGAVRARKGPSYGAPRLEIPISAIADAAREQFANGGSRPAPPAPVEFHYTQSDSFVALLHELGATLLIKALSVTR
jgi:hypothetical protein